jgi:hypothetical protein
MQPTMRNQVSNTAESQRSEKGFAIPIAMGMGLIMILLATTAIVRSQNQGIAAINKSAKDQSRSIAELKVAQIQAFLNKYRGAANLSSAQWGSATGTSFPTANALCIAPSTLTGTGSAISEVNSMASGAWTDVVANGTKQGEVRLISYTGNDGSLTVEGRTRVGTPAESLSQVTVAIPVFSPDQDQVAGLWAKTSVAGSPVVKSDVLGPCTGTMDAVPTSAGTGSNPATVRTRLAMPNAPVLPTSTTLPNSTTGSVVEMSSAGTIIKAFHNFTAPTTPITIASLTNRELPRYKVAETISGVPKEVPVDVPDADGVYKYIVSSLDSSFKISVRDDLAKRIANSRKPTGQLASTAEIDVEKAALQSVKVSIWVTGNIDLQNKVIVNPCGAGGSSSSCDPFDVRVYGTSTSSPTLTLNQTGTAVCDVFFHLPNYAATVNAGGTANTQDCGAGSKNTGIYWVNTWNSATGTTLDANRGRWVDAPIQFLPRIGPLTELGS